MSYKRYVKIGGKLYGPYEYHSFRDKDGSVKSEYIQKSSEDNFFRIAKNNYKLSIMVSLIVCIVLFISIFGTNPFTFTGMSVVENQYSENLNLEISPENVNVYTWTPEFQHENITKITSVKVSGNLNIIGNGRAKVYLGNKLILDSSLLEKSNNGQNKKDNSKTNNLITGMIISDESASEGSSSDSSDTSSGIESETSAEPVITENQDTNPGQVVESNIIDTNIELTDTSLDNNQSSASQELNTQDNETETLGENATNTNSLNENTSAQENEKNSKVKTISFSQVCEETCNLSDLNLIENDFELRFELENSNISLTEIFYTTTDLETLDNNVDKIEENLTNLTEVNATEINVTENFTEQTFQYNATINEPVKWLKKIYIKNVSKAEPKQVNIKLPKESSNISLKEKNNKIENKKSKSEKFDSYQEDKETVIEINATSNEYELVYETPAPQIFENIISEKEKEITITEPDSVHYQNVSAFIDIRELSEESRNRIRLYWLVNDTRELMNITYLDNNNNSLIDRIEWIVPHLSEQKFLLIIEISKAEHLDENYSFISDIYDQVKAKDDIWSEQIYDKEYVRVTFETNLTSSRDITLYARNNESKRTIIEVYYFNSSEKITEFPIINEEKYYTVLLEGMIGEHDVFDLRIKNLDNDSGAYLEIDHIIDPYSNLSRYFLRGSTSSGNLSNQSLSTTSGATTAYWKASATAVQLVNFISGSLSSAQFVNGTLPITLWCNSSNTTGAPVVQIPYYYVYDCTDSGCTSRVQICYSGIINLNCSQATLTQRSSTACVNSSGWWVASGHYLETVIAANSSLTNRYANIAFNSSTYPSQINITNIDFDPKAEFGTNPIDNYNSTNKSITFGLRCSDGVGVSYIRIWTNTTGTWHANYTNTSYTNNTWINVTIGGINDNTNYKWQVWCNDTAGNSNYTTNRTFSVDSTSPIAYQGTNPVDYYNSTSSSVTFDMRCLDNKGVSSIQLWSNFTGTWAANYTNSSYTNNTWINISRTIPDKKYYIWQVRCNDTSGGTNNTVNRTLTVDATAPVVSNTTVNSTKVKANEAVCVNTTITESVGISLVWSMVSFPNGTQANITLNSGMGACWGGVATSYGAEINVGSLAGKFTLNTSFANDTLGNLGYQSPYPSLNVTVDDAVAPTAEFGTNPIDNYNDTDGSITFDFRCSDNINVSTIQLWGNWSSASDSCSGTLNCSFAGNNYTKCGTCSQCDASSYGCVDNPALNCGVLNQTQCNNVPNSCAWQLGSCVNVAPGCGGGMVPLPECELLEEYGAGCAISGNCTELGGGSCDTCSDPATCSTNCGWANCTWNSPWHANYTNTSYTNNTWLNITVGGIPNGPFKWAVWCNDTTGNEDYTDTNRTFRVDSTNPVASFGNNPIDNYNDTDGSITFDLKCSDNAGVSWIQLWTNSTGTWHANYTNSSYTNNTWLNITVDGIPNGQNYKWQVWCNDSVASENNTQNRTFNESVAGADATNPVAVQGTNPVDVYNTSNSSVTFDMKCYDDVGVSMIRLWTNTTGTWHANYSNSSYTNNTWLNITVPGIPEGYYKWDVWCNDTTNNNNQTINRTFKVDTTLPVIVWENPTPSNASNQSQNAVYLNTTITDSLPTSAFFDWNKTLAGYWAMDFYNSTGVYDNSSYSNFGRFGGTNFGSNNITNGKYGRGLVFDGVDDYVYTNTLSNFSGTDKLSNFAWIYATSYPSSDGLTISTQQWLFYLQLTTSGYLRAYLYGTSSPGYHSSNSTVPLNEWHYVGHTYDGSNIIFYIDGNPSGTISDTGNMTWGGGSERKYMIGGENSDGYNYRYFNGSIEEVRVYSRVLSVQEINAAYNNGLYRLYNNFTGLSEGLYDYKAYAMDMAGNLNITGTRQVRIDTTGPTVTLPVYTNATLYKNTQNLVYNISVTDSGSGPGYCSIAVGTNANITVQVSSGWCNGTNYALTGLTDGNKTIYAYANDSAGNVALNNSYVVWMDSTSPVAAQGTNPIDYYNDTDGSITFDLKCTDNVGVSTIQLWTNSTGTWHANYTNSSYQNNTWLNITITIPDGNNYKWQVWCNDTSGNSNYTNNRTYNVDLLPPIAYQGTNPVDYYNTTDQSVTFDMRCTDNLAISYLQLWANWSGTWRAEYSNTSYVNNTWVNKTISGIPGGASHQWAIRCNDTFDRSNITQNRTLNISVPFQINFSYVAPTPANISRQIANSVTINVSVNGTNSISACLLYWDSGSGYASENMTREGSGTNVFCSKTKATVDGTNYWYKVYANDTLGNSNYSDAQTFRENTKPPVLTLNAPADLNHTTNRTPNFSWTMSSDEDGDTLTTMLNISPNCASLNCNALDSRLNNVTNNGVSYTLLDSEKLKNLFEAGDYQDNYSWKVITWDGYEWSTSYSITRTIFIDSQVVLTLINDTTNFGTMLPNDKNDTTDDSPNPLLLENDGNCYVNVNLSSFGLLWESLPGQGPSNYYLYKVDRFNEWDSFNYGQSQTSWAQAPITNFTSVVSQLNYAAGNNRSEIDINVTVPGDEPSGSKSSLLSFTGYYVHDPS
jgi:hypothetical protein